MPTVEENYKLLWCILIQKMNNGILEDIDWSTVGTHLGIDKAVTANQRYNRLKEEFNKLGFPLTEKGVKARAKAATETTPTKSTANPKARSAVSKSNTKSTSKVKTTSKGKKSKAEVKSQDDDVDEKAADAQDSDNRQDDNDSDDY